MSKAKALCRRDSADALATPGILAQGVEFVTLPGMAEKLQTVIPEAMHNALGNDGSFSGCMVLVSERETRLMTVITLWTGTDRARQCAKNAEHLNQLLLPYVDRWLGTRRMAALLCML